MDLLVLKTELLLKAVNTAAGINQLLLARKEGMALGANFNTDILFGGAGLNHFAARTTNRRLCIFRMDALFHCTHLFPELLTIV